MTVHRLQPSSYFLLQEYVTPSPREFWVEEVEDFITKAVPIRKGLAQDSVVEIVRNSVGEHIAVAAHLFNSELNVEHIQAFVMHPSFRGLGASTSAFLEIVEFLLEQPSEVSYVTWSVRHENSPMLRMSQKVGEAFSNNDEFVGFVRP